MSFCAESTPIRTIDFTSPTDVVRHDWMVALVECTAEGVDLHKKLAAEGAPHVKTVLQRHAKGGDDGQTDRRAGV
jgi:hypothetical protein